jgi:hypothetical protein
MVSMSGRHEWVVADLRCILCSRILGRLVGPLPEGRADARPTAGRLHQFSAFRPAEPTAPTVPLTGTELFRCPTCGGGGFIDEVETFSTYDDVEEEDPPRPNRRGRPPKPWRRLVDHRLTDLGLAG